MVPQSVRAGDILADRYQLADLLVESEGGLFWRARDLVLSRSVAVHVIGATDPRAPLLMKAARRSATVRDHRILQVLDTATIGSICYVINEWGAGESLDILLTREGPMEPTRAAWLISEVAGALAVAHDCGVEHGRLVPENVLIDHNGNVRLIGLAVDAALHGAPAGQRAADIHDLAALLYAALTDRWPGSPRSSIAAAPVEGGRVLRPRRVRAGIPRFLDDLCDVVLNRGRGGAHARLRYDLATAAGIAEALVEFVGDPEEYAAAERQRHAAVDADHPIGQVTAILPSMAAPPYQDPSEIEAAQADGRCRPTRDRSSGPDARHAAARRSAHAGRHAGLPRRRRLLGRKPRPWWRRQAALRSRAGGGGTGAHTPARHRRGGTAAVLAVGRGGAQRSAARKAPLARSSTAGRPDERGSCPSGRRRSRRWRCRPHLRRLHHE